jgi:peptide/nickel transport system permease protein
LFAYHLSGNGWRSLLPCFLLTRDTRGLPSVLRVLAPRLARFVAVLLIGGLLGAALVRVAPGFGTDERMLDTRLSNASIQAIARERDAGSNILFYYAQYLGRLAKGDLGKSVSLGRPVRELLAERASVSLRSVSAGLLSAWLASLGLVLLLEWLSFQPLRTAASLSAGALLCVPAALLAIGCFYFSGPPALAIAAILSPRIFRYTQNLVRRAAEAPHVFAAHAYGESRWRILRLHVLAPVVPELVALGGVSVSIAVGAAIPVEALCDSPGVGQLVWQAALARDLPVIVNVTLLITALTLAANLAADVARGMREGAS